MNHHSYKHMAILIRHARIKKELTQTELAKAIRMGTDSRRGQFISNIERAKCGLPVPFWKRATEVLDVTFTQLKSAKVHDVSDSISLEYYK